MESGRNKRKIGDETEENCDHEEEEEDDDDDDEKVEKFFALIRSTKEMRDRLRKVPNELSKEEEDKKKKEEEKPAAASILWNNIPVLQVEDFMKMKDSKSRNPLVNDAAAGPSSKQETQDKETRGGGGEDGTLDLNLSL